MSLLLLHRHPTSTGASYNALTRLSNDTKHAYTRFHFGLFYWFEQKVSVTGISSSVLKFFESSEKKSFSLDADKN